MMNKEKKKHRGEKSEEGIFLTDADHFSKMKTLASLRSET
jgi:hypothetical protein